MNATRRAVFSVAALVAAACRPAEAPEAARARSQKAFLQRQIAGLEELLGKAERGELVTLDQIAIGIEETVAGDIIRASLPRDVTFKGLVVRVESARPLFRGNQAGVLFRGRVHAVGAPLVFAAAELGGTLDEFKLVSGRLSARVKLVHVADVDSSVGALGRGTIEGLIRDNLGAIERAIPPIEIPVAIEEEMGTDDGRLGPVTVQPGQLPLRITVARVIPVGGRLWILLDAAAGPWQRVARAAAP